MAALQDLEAYVLALKADLLRASHAHKHPSLDARLPAPILALILEHLARLEDVASVRALSRRMLQADDWSWPARLVSFFGLEPASLDGLEVTRQTFVDQLQKEASEISFARLDLDTDSFASAFETLSWHLLRDGLDLFTANLPQKTKGQHLRFQPCLAWLSKHDANYSVAALACPLFSCSALAEGLEQDILLLFTSSCLRKLRDSLDWVWRDGGAMGVEWACHVSCTARIWSEFACRNDLMWEYYRESMLRLWPHATSQATDPATQRILVAARDSCANMAALAAERRTREGPPGSGPTILPLHHLVRRALLRSPPLPSTKKGLAGVLKRLLPELVMHDPDWWP